MTPTSNTLRGQTRYLKGLTTKLPALVIGPRSETGSTWLGLESSLGLHGLGEFHARQRARRKIRDQNPRILQSWTPCLDQALGAGNSLLTTLLYMLSLPWNTLYKFAAHPRNIPLIKFRIPVASKAYSLINGR